MVSMPSSVIGSGWLPRHAERVRGCRACKRLIISWIVGAVLLIGIALIYAELGATYPISGGTARFTWIHTGTLGGFFCGTFSYLQAVAIAPIEVEASLGYLNAKWWHGLENSSSLLTGKGLVVGIVAMFVFTALNLLGVQWMAKGNTSVMMVWKILVPVLTIILIMSKAVNTSNFSTCGRQISCPTALSGVFIALPLGIIFALEGFEQAAQIAGEARNPKRDIPIAVVGSMLVGAALYLALQVCFIGALNPANVVHGLGQARSETSLSKFGPYYTLATSRSALAGSAWS